jgi:hypothetical protein
LRAFAFFVLGLNTPLAREFQKDLELSIFCSRFAGFSGLGLKLSKKSETLTVSGLLTQDRRTSAVSWAR